MAEMEVMEMEQRGRVVRRYQYDSQSTGDHVSLNINIATSHHARAPTRWTATNLDAWMKIKPCQKWG